MTTRLIRFAIAALAERSARYQAVGVDYSERPCRHIIDQDGYTDNNGKTWAQCILCGQLFGGLA